MAAVQINPGLDLFRARGPVSERCVDLPAGDGPFAGEGVSGVRNGGEIVNPHGDLPHIRSADQPGTPSGRPVPERDHRMLIPARPFLGVAAQSVRDRLAGGSGGQFELLSETVINSDGHVDGHDLQSCHSVNSREMSNPSCVAVQCRAFAAQEALSPVPESGLR